MKKTFISITAAVLTVVISLSCLVLTAGAAGKALPDEPGCGLRIDRDREVIYNVPQYFGYYDLLSLLTDNGVYYTEGAHDKSDIGVTGDNINVILPGGSTEVFTLAVLGDLLGTGRSSAADARESLRLAVGLDGDQYDGLLRAADVDLDGSITSADARAILRCAVELEPLTAASLGRAYVPKNDLTQSGSDTDSAASLSDGTDSSGDNESSQTGLLAAVYKDKVSLTWQAADGAESYGIFCISQDSMPYEWDYDTKAHYEQALLSAAVKEGTVTASSSALSFDVTGLDCASKYYTLLVQPLKAGAACGSLLTADTSDTDSRLNAAVLSPHDSFSVVSARSDDSTWTYNISADDKLIMQGVIDKVVKPGMSRREELYAIYSYLQDSFTYARGSDYTKIANKSAVDAIVNYHLGQCLQYNGAMAEFMAYLGYDVNMVHGYRQSRSSGKISHYWTEVNIGGLTYLMEVGQDGWGYFLVRYDESDGRYMKNGVLMTTGG